MTPHDIRRIAVEARVDPRTVQAFLGRWPVRELSRLRIKEAIERLGLRPKREKEKP